MTCLLGQPEYFGLVRGGLGESAEFGEAPDEPVTIVDRCGLDVPEILADPVGGQCGKVVGRERENPLVLAPIVVRLLEKARGEDAELQVPRRPRDRQRPAAASERLVQLSALGMGVRHERVHTASPALVVQSRGQGLGLAEALQRPTDLTEHNERAPQLEVDFEGLLQG